VLRKKVIIFVCLSIVILSASCTSYYNLKFFPANKMNKLPLFSPKNQKCLCDTLKIYFTQYPNPFYDRSFIYFYSELEGDLLVKNIAYYEKDTIQSNYEFENEGPGLYTIEFINFDYGDHSLETRERQEERRNRLGKIISSRWELYLDSSLKCYHTRQF